MNPIKKLWCRAFQTGMRMAIPLLPYRKPNTLGSVEDIPALLRERKLERVLIVTDPGVMKLGLTRRLEEALAREGVAYAIYDKTVANPTTTNVEEARALYFQEKCQALIAVGGGSAMDCAKGVGVRIARPATPLSKCKGILKVLLPLPTLIAIPTTAGTGSETTVTSVIVDAETRHKYTINDFPLIPGHAVLDPEMTVSLPPHLTASTGLDALTHAVEAYIGRSTTRDTREDALEATRLIFANLDRAYSDGADVEARRNMLNASFKAGCAFTKSYVGYVHAVAHSLGGEYNVPHGLANAVILPMVLEAYGSVIHEKLRKLAVAAGVADEDTPKELAARTFIDEVKAMKKRFGIGDTIPELRREDIPKLARYADKEANPLYPVPVLMDAAELEQFYYQLLEEPAMDESIETIVEKQRAYFQSGATLDVEARLTALRTLRNYIRAHEEEINAAVKADLGKSAMESYMCETGLTLSEISYMLKHTRSFAREKTVLTPLTNFHSHSYKKPSPYGVTLIMSPWNYPFLLTIEPLVDAIAAGNTAVVKPSAYSPHTSEAIRRMIRTCFDPRYVAVVTGGRQENAALLSEHFDYIFFTGSQAVGKEVMRRAAERLTPTTLELGGKSPCIVEKSADIKLAARRIAFGKYLNCGQTCVAPDYILCDPAVKDELAAELKKEIAKQYGESPLDNPDYGRIINEKHFDRLLGLIDPAKVVCGGGSDGDALRIEPTVMTDVTWDDAVMGEEIFGPILPILTYDSVEDVIDTVNRHPHPLALYIFTSDKDVAREVTARCGFGGGCVNDVVIHLATSEMGFGGFGESGMGAYHGKAGFDTFTHYKSIVDKKTWIDLPMRYQPYKKLYEVLIRMFLK